MQQNILFVSHCQSITLQMFSLNLTHYPCRGHRAGRWIDAMSFHRSVIMPLYLTLWETSYHFYIVTVDLLNHLNLVTLNAHNIYNYTIVLVILWKLLMVCSVTVYMQNVMQSTAYHMSCVVFLHSGPIVFVPYVSEWTVCCRYVFALIPLWYPIPPCALTVSGK